MSVKTQKKTIDREEDAPAFWRSWKCLYSVQLIYWILVLLLLILGTRLLNS